MNEAAPVPKVVDLQATSNSGDNSQEYYFYCNRSDDGTNITLPYNEYSGNNNVPVVIDNLCDYAIAGTYKPKILVRRTSDGALAQDHATVTVSGIAPPVITVTMSASPDTGVETVNSILTAIATTDDPLQTFNYSIWYNCANTTTSVQTANTACGTLTAPPVGTCIETVDIGYKCDGIFDTEIIQSHTYSSPATYRPKVILEQGTATNVQSQDTVTVSPDTAPVASNVTVDAGDYCTSTMRVISWNYDDADDVPLGTDPQFKYQIQVDDNAGFASPEIDQTFNSDSTSFTASGLDFNMTYYARVKVWDTLGNQESAWSNPPNNPNNTFTTPTHAYPSPDFSWIPSNPKINQLITFDAGDTRYYGTIPLYGWEFMRGDDYCIVPDECTKSSAGGEITTNTFKTTDTFKILLTATDDVGSCTITPPKTINLRGLRLPQWKEISPR